MHPKTSNLGGHAGSRPIAGVTILSPSCSLVLAVVVASLAPKTFYNWALQPGPAILIMSVLFGTTAYLLGCHLARVLASLGLLLAAMMPDLVPGMPFLLQASAGVAMSLAALLASLGMPRKAAPVKVLLWLTSCYIQSIWIFDLLSTEQKMSFFGWHGVR